MPYCTVARRERARRALKSSDFLELDIGHCDCPRPAAANRIFPEQGARKCVAHFREKIGVKTPEV